MERRTYALLLAYDGQASRGWQRQPGAVTVQETVEVALSRALELPIQVHGASRTDAGVHADGQVASFSVRRALGDEELARLGAALPVPPWLTVRAAAGATPSFHARASAVGKRYRYDFCWGERSEARAFWLGAQAAPRWDRASAALRGLEELADVRGLASPSRTKAPAPKLERATLEESRAGTVSLDIAGPAFRKHQIRNLAGHLAAVALGLAEPESLALLAARDRPWCGATAPAHGLTLLEVRYPPTVDPFRSACPTAPAQPPR